MEELNALSERVIGLAIQVHRELWPGLLESTYGTCLCYELNQAGIEFFEEVQVPIKYKISQEIIPVHEAQLLTYLKHKNIKLRLLLNFNVKLLKNGIIRKIN